MARRVFFSFHYKPDHARASQVRNMGRLEGNQVVSDNDWERITRGGDMAIERWIEGQMHGKSCAVVLIGSHTGGRKWIKHEIRTAWDSKRGIVGIYVHNLKDLSGKQSAKGRNPFAGIRRDGALLSSIVRAYDPPFSMSPAVYRHISDNMERWVEEAIAIRKLY